MALSYPVPPNAEGARHAEWRTAHPFPPFAAVPQVPEEDKDSDEGQDLESEEISASPPDAHEEVAPNPYAIYAITNAMTQEEADAIPASDFHFLMQEVRFLQGTEMALCDYLRAQALRFVSLHALNANTDTALVSIPRPLRNNSLDGVPQWAQAFINAFYIEADLAALIFIGQELQIEMYVAA
jgi:hypothetical protein